MGRPRYTIEDRRRASMADVQRMRDAGIESAKFRFGHTLAGHCGYSERMDGKVAPLNDACPLPHSDCEHPDQCGCRWQSWIPLMDKIEKGDQSAAPINPAEGPIRRWLQRLLAPPR